MKMMHLTDLTFYFSEQIQYLFLWSLNMLNEYLLILTFTQEFIISAVFVQYTMHNKYFIMLTKTCRLRTLVFTEMTV